MALHWVRITADPTPQLGVHVHNRSGDLYTDEGWDSAGAIAAARFGHWYQPGQFNLAVDAPVWSAILAVPFETFGVSARLARSLEVAFFAGAVVLFYFLIKALHPEDEDVRAWTVLILATSYLAFNFSRLSILESIWTFFMVGSLLALAKALQKKSSALVILAGILLGLAVITKATAMCAFLPAAALIVLLCEEPMMSKAGKCTAYVAGFLLTYGPYLWIFRNRFSADHQYYERVNLAAREVHSLGGWVHSLAAVIAGVRYFGFPIALAFLGGAVLFLVLKGKQMLDLRRHPLPVVFAVWIVGDVLVRSTISYHPARYLVNPLFPVAALTAFFMIEAAKQLPKAGRAAALGILVLITAAGAIGEARALLHPHYTLDTAAGWMATSAGQPAPVVMGDCANTLALHAPLRPMDDLLGVRARPDRIRQYDPALYVSLGPVLAERVRDFTVAGRSLILIKTEDALGDYVQGKRLFIYRVVRS